MEEIKRLLQKNLEYTKEIHAEVLKIKKKLMWQKIFSIIKVVIVLIPLIIGLIYAIPFLQQAAEAYGQVLGIFQGQESQGSIFETLEMLK